ncbi:MAG TPA: hypothetical protein VG674_17705 [Amycolatopsis sp.]|nr:hypothetical protein [Amycolatopsis sp.]
MSARTTISVAATGPAGDAEPAAATGSAHHRLFVRRCGEVPKAERNGSKDFAFVASCAMLGAC